ncbi:MAG: dihydroorotase [Methanocellales archaeon]
MKYPKCRALLTMEAMVKYELAIKNGKVFLKDKIIQADIGIENGKIARAAKIVEGFKVINASKMLVLPGSIDVHVHFREPGLTHKEDWYTGSCAAAAGGVTSVIDQPNTIPPTTTAKAFKKKLKLAKQKSIVDFGINAGVIEKSEIEEMWKLGAIAFGEIFLADSMAVDYSFLNSALERIGKLQGLACVHAEDSGLIMQNLKKYKNLTPISYSRVRSPRCEALAIQRVLGLYEKLKIKPRLHICHLSTKLGLKLLKQSSCTAEVTPHHLLLNLKDCNRLGNLAKVNPPLRSKVDQLAVLRAFIKGEVSILASDHAPHLPIEKQDLCSSPSGMPGVETMIPLLLALVKKRLIPLEKLVNAASKNPARIFKIKNKGEIKPGMDADLLITDLKPMKIKAKRLHSKCNWTPFEGFEAIFPKLTLLRGEVIFQGNVTCERGFGRILMRND